MDSPTRFSACKLLVSFSVICFALFHIGCGGGTTGNNPSAPTWEYTALGDSLADGVLAQQGYVERYATYVNLDTGSNVNTTNLGVPGWHSGDLLNAIQTDQGFHDRHHRFTSARRGTSAAMISPTLTITTLREPAAARTTRTVCGTLSRPSRRTGTPSSPTSCNCGRPATPSSGPWTSTILTLLRT